MDEDRTVIILPFRSSEAKKIVNFCKSNTKEYVLQNYKYFGFYLWKYKVLCVLPYKRFLHPHISFLGAFLKIILIMTKKCTTNLLQIKRVLIYTIDYWSVSLVTVKLELNTFSVKLWFYIWFKVVIKYKFVFV